MNATVTRLPSARAFFAVALDVDQQHLVRDVRERAAARMKEFLPTGSDVVQTDQGVAAVVHVAVGDAEHVARLLARRMLSVLREPYRLPAGQERARPSVGIVCVRSDEHGAFTDTLGRAEIALARARSRPVEPIAFEGDQAPRSQAPPAAAA